MGESIQCQICDKLATVHLTQIIQNKIHKVHLCEECAQEKGVTDPDGLSFEDLFSKSGLVSEVKPAGGDLVCEQCGLSTSDFRKSGRLGCPACYDHFREVVNPMLQGMHKGILHRGKVPQRAMERVSLHERLNELDEKLQTAIADERYEEAAQYRDEISQVKESKLSNTQD